MLEEPILGECLNKADMTSFFYTLTKVFVEDLLLSLSNSVESVLITQPGESIRQTSLALIALSDNETFLTKVMLPLVERRAKETNGDLDRDMILDLVSKKVSAEKRKWEARWLEAAAQEIRGVLAALTVSLLEDGVLPSEANFLDSYLDGLRDRGSGLSSELTLACCKLETKQFLEDLTTRVEVRPTLLKLCLFVRAESAAVAKADKSLGGRLAKLFAETLVAQTFDTYFAVTPVRDNRLEAAFSVDLEFSMLWLARFVDEALLEKAKRLRSLTLAALEKSEYGGGDFAKALKSYLRGCKLKYAYVAPV